MERKKLIFIDIDGINPDVFYRAADNKNTNLHRLAGRGLRVERAVTVFPAVTLCCQASMFTGVFPGKHWIMGNSWFDRRRTPPVFRFYTDAKTAAGNYGFGLFGWPTIVLPERPGLDFANRDLNPDVKLIYEDAKAAGLCSWQIFNQYSKGVDRWIKPSRGAMVLFALCHEELVHNRNWDRATFNHLFKAMRGRELPDLLVFYISGLDNHSHECGADEQYKYFTEVVDPLLGELIAQLEKRAPLEEYYFLITADHGQACVTREEQYIILNETLSEILGAVPGGGFQLSRRTEFRATDTAVANMEAGATQFSLINRATFEWADAPRFEQDVLPAADAFLTYKKGPTPFVDFVMVRRTEEEGYLVYNGGGLKSLEEFFAGRDAEYPDAVRRIRELNSARSGDLIVFLDYSTGHYFGDKVKAGEHGGIGSLDSLIPLTVSGPDIPDKVVPTASLVDAAPTAAAILGFDMPTAQGKSLV